jgi:hypothetical protein
MNQVMQDNFEIAYLVLYKYKIQKISLDEHMYDDLCMMLYIHSCVLVLTTNYSGF